MRAVVTVIARVSGSVSDRRLPTKRGYESPISHFPPGTNQWNKIEHCLSCHIMPNWRGRRVTAEFDKREYPWAKG